MAFGPQPRYRVLPLEDIEALSIPASLTWRPVRGRLGVRAFGVGSYVADAAGQDVIEPHSESRDGRGHEELYFVVRGHARFELDGDTHDAPAGTLVFVAPDVHRHGVATQPGTEVLAFGGDPVFEPSGSEWMWRVRPLLPDHPQSAQALVDEGLAETPESPGLWYAQALVAAAAERPELAREWLMKAVEREPRLLDEARAEELLAGLDDDLTS